MKQDEKKRSVFLWQRLPAVAVGAAVENLNSRTLHTVNFSKDGIVRTND